LDHFIGWSEHNKSYKLLISGGGPHTEVHFTGYIEMDDSEDHDDFVPGEILEIEEKKSKKESLTINLDLNEKKREPIQVNGKSDKAGKMKHKKDHEFENSENRGENNKSKENQKILDYKANDAIGGKSLNKDQKINLDTNKDVKKLDKKKEANNKSLDSDLVDSSNNKEIENLLKKKTKNVESDKPKKVNRMKTDDNKINKDENNLNKNINQKQLAQKKERKQNN